MNRRGGVKRAGPGLTPETIVRSALAIIEGQGLPAFSARRLAAALGCEAMSLYYYFPNMDALLDAVVDALLTGQRIDNHEAQSSAVALRQAAMAYLMIAEQHPHAFQLVATRRWHTPNALAAAQSMVGAFASAGFPPDLALRKTRILAAYLNGAGMALSAWRKSDGMISDEVATALNAVTPDNLRAESVQADLVKGLEMLVEALVQYEDARALA